MNSQKTIITCAVTGGDENSVKSGNVPITPREIADAAIEAWNAGAAIAHIHVRDPKTGRPSMALEYYREVVERIRSNNTDLIINLTSGPGARFVPGSERNSVDPNSNLCTPVERVRHILELRPEICSLDMGSINYWNGALINVPSHVEAMAAAIVAAGVKPELEVFDSGQIALANSLVKKGLIGDKLLFQFVLGAVSSAPATAEMLLALRSLMPKGSTWAAFGVGRTEFRILAQAFMLGGHVRVGLEDNLYLEKGVLAPSNASLVEKGVRLIRELGGEIATPAEAREMLGIASSLPVASEMGMRAAAGGR